MQKPIEGVWTTAQEISKLLKISDRQVHRLPIEKKKLGPRCVRFLVSSLNEYLATRA